MVSGTLIGALAVGFLAQGFSQLFRAPAVAFAFAGVVAMIPGAFAFRVVIGSLQIVNAGAATDAALVTETLALTVTCVLMVAAIAIGIVAPLTLVTKRRSEVRTRRGGGHRGNRFTTETQRSRSSDSEGRMVGGLAIDDSIAIRSDFSRRCLGIKISYSNRRRRKRLLS